MYIFYSAAVCSFFGGPQNIKIRQNVWKYLSLSLPPFIKSTPPFHFYIKYIDIQNISIHNEKWYLQLCNLLFLVRCWSQTCDLVCNTLQFQHLNLIWVNTKHHFVLWTSTSFPGLSVVEQTPHCISLSVLGQWSLFCTLNQLVEGVGLPCGVVWGWSILPPPVILCIRCTQGWDYLLSVYCLSVSLLFTVTFKYPVSLRKHFPEYLALVILLIGTCVANVTCLQQTVPHPT